MISFLRRNGSGITLITATYFYFLIFAQFAFIELLNADLPKSLKAMMATMALSGIIGSLITPLILPRFGTPTILRAALIACAAASALAIPAHHFSTYLAVSALIGLSLGVLTVSLTASLQTLLSPNSWGLAIGTGTGLAYAFANLPAVFATSPEVQSIISTACVIVALLSIRQTPPDPESPAPSPSSQSLIFPLALLSFLALVWLDSAAFFIIQHTPALKDQSWAQSHLWKNALIHFSFALLAGHLLQRKKTTLVTTSAFALLTIASLCLNHQEIALVGGWLYPAAVSLYSTALVACPVYLTRFKKNHSPAWAAAILYSVAGWFGSANGIGMAENLKHIPLLFLAIAACIFIIPHLLPHLKNHRAAALLVLGISALAFFIPTTSATSPPQSGQQVYLSEGCIHCHSRYIRPDSPDLLKWGPVVPLAELRKEAPVTIGNRRAGPDLLNVGNRRSSAWLKQHFIDPQSLSPESSMPSYRHLFEGDDPRGNQLIEFISQQGLKSLGNRIQTAQSWTPNFSGNADGPDLYTQHCIACHGSDGLGEGPLSKRWSKPPANLVKGPFTYSRDGSQNSLARIIKFGIPGTDMPGHETLSDNEVLALAQYLKALR